MPRPDLISVLHGHRHPAVSDRAGLFTIVFSLLLVASNSLAAAPGLAPGPAPTQHRSVDPSPHPVPRRLLALSASPAPGEASSDTNIVQQHFAMPLQHLGIDLYCRSFAAGPPPSLDPLVWRGVLVHVAGGDTVPTWLVSWLDEQRRRGLRLLLLGDLERLFATGSGASADATSAAAAATALFGSLGLDWRPGHVTGPLRLAVRASDTARTAFEQPPTDSWIHRGPRVREAREPEAQVHGPAYDIWLETADRRHPDDVRHQVVTGHFGAIALQPWILDLRGSAFGATHWHLDPFRFFRDALGLRGVPVPDPCVRHGRRRMFCHVDGAGFRELSTVRPGALASEVFRDEIIDRFRLPLTVAFNVAEITRRPPEEIRDTAATDLGMRVATSILQRSWVEPASCGMLQVSDWQADHLDLERPRSVAWQSRFGSWRPSATGQVHESVRFLDRFVASPDRPVRMMQWSGLANPGVEALEATTDLQLGNVNGSAFRFDAAHPSVSGVPALSQRIGVPADLSTHGVLQVHSGAAADVVYSGTTGALEGAFQHVDETLTRTGSPRILAPANLHLSFHSARSRARLEVVRDLLEKWTTQRATCVTATADWHAAVVGSLEDCRITPLPDGQGYALSGFARCTTLRIDSDLNPGRIDWERSLGIVGATRIGDSLYLDVGSPSATLRLLPDSAPTTRGDPRPWPTLLGADHPCTAIERDAQSVRLQSHAVAGRSRLLQFRGFAPGSEVRLRIGEALGTELVRCDSSGSCEVRFTGTGTVSVEVRAQ